MNEQLFKCLQAMENGDNPSFIAEMNHLIYLYWNSEQLQSSENYDSEQQEIINIIVG